MQHIWVCECKVQTPCGRKGFEAGSVFQCPGCLEVFGCLRSKPGPKVWVKLTKQDVEFHDLLGEKFARFMAEDEAEEQKYLHKAAVDKTSV